MTRNGINPLEGTNLIDSYISVGDQHSHNNPRMHLGLCLGLLGECLSDCSFKQGDESCRVHPLIIQRSGTGKDSAFSVAEKIANRVDQRLPEEESFDFHSVDDITNGNLVGTVVDGKKRPGQADLHDILAFREVGALFEKPSLRDRLRIVMDDNEVTREMRGGTIETKSACTFIGTTPPERIPPQKVATLLGEGTLARPLYFFKPVDVYDTTNLIGEILTDASTDSTRERNISSDKEEELIERIVVTLVQIAEHYSTGVEFEINISEEVLHKAIQDRIKHELERYSDTVLEITQPLLTRYSVHALRLACLMAALDEYSHVVEKNHLAEAMDYWEQSFQSMLQYFERHSDEFKGANRRAIKAERDAYQRKLEMLTLIIEIPGIRQKAIKDKMVIGAESVRKYAKDLEEKGAIFIKNSGNSARYYPVDNSPDQDIRDYM